ncbi:hypothetical protein [Streptomyces sp. NRRL S-337]|nr:hypothetical protein [Streptomyces sp. NRRL S-337]
MPKDKGVRNENAIDRKDNANSAKQAAQKRDLVDKMRDKVNKKG